MPERLKWFGGGADYPGIHSICVDPRDSRTLRIAISCGGVWKSTDGGSSWALTSKGLFAEYMPPEERENPNIQDPHRMRQCPAEPDRLWIQHHNGVFQSRDGARTWQHCADVPPCGNGFGFAVAVHPKRGDTAWLVPAIKDECRVPLNGSVVVTRTTDGGGTWEVLSKGLPQQDAYDIVYRHAFDVDGVGEALAFGSTTGSLWFSRDAGSSWRGALRALAADPRRALRRLISSQRGCDQRKDQSIHCALFPYTRATVPRVTALLIAWCLQALACAEQNPASAPAEPGQAASAQLRGMWSYDVDATAAGRQQRGAGGGAAQAPTERFDQAATITVVDDHVDTAAFVGADFTVMTWRMVGNREGRLLLEATDDHGAVQRAEIALVGTRIAWSEQGSVAAVFSRAVAIQRCCSDPMPRGAKR